MAARKNKKELTGDIHTSYSKLRKDLEGIPLKLTKANELAGHAKDTRMSVCNLISIKENPGGGVKSL